VDKVQFINTLFEMYPNSYTESNIQMWFDLLVKKLPNDIDFQELFDDMLTSYQNTTQAPSTSFLVNLAAKQKERNLQQAKAQEAIKQAEQWKKEREEIEKEDKPVIGEILSPLEVLKEAYRGEARIGENHYFTKEEMQTFSKYARTVIPTEKLRIKFWQQVCSLISGGRINELCRNL